jgi:predicted metal-dependent hydrolase
MEDNFVNYTVIYSRRKTLCISIRHGEGVTVRAPSGISEKEIQRFINEKREWISRHLRAQELRIKTDKEKYCDGDHFMLGGKTYKIEVVDSESWRINFNGEKVVIGSPEKSNARILNLILRDFFSRYAESVIKTAFSDILVRLNSHGLKPTGLKIRKMKSKWGSCSTKGSITLNSQLARLEPGFLEYVIIHELCHLRHHNHGKMFYAMLSGLFPEWKETRKELKKYQG